MLSGGMAGLPLPFVANFLSYTMRCEQNPERLAIDAA
jgi:hypothetical protein